jgi:hypothetical protein
MVKVKLLRLRLGTKRRRGGAESAALTASPRGGSWGRAPEVLARGARVRKLERYAM